jgi:hypothetical protein
LLELRSAREVQRRISVKSMLHAFSVFVLAIPSAAYATSRDAPERAVKDKSAKAGVSFHPWRGITFGPQGRLQALDTDRAAATVGLALGGSM